MERLTKRISNGKIGYALLAPGECVDVIDLLHVWGDRLADYEDTMPLEQAQELAQAEKDGRMVVLPCKVGDTVYVTYGEGYKVCIVDRIHVIANNQVQVRIRNLLTETLWLSVSKFDKTVFRTREEAEAALKKREEENTH